MQRVTLLALLMVALGLARPAAAQVNSHEVQPGDLPAGLSGSAYADLLMPAPAGDAVAETFGNWGRCRPASNEDLRRAGSQVNGGVAKLVVPGWACDVQVSFTSYRLPGGLARPFEDQEVFHNVTKTYRAGKTHTINVNLPACAWQTDLYVGPVIEHLIPNVGHPTNKLIAWSLKENASCGTASLGDRVWYDVDGDGRQGGFLEGGVSGVTVTLFNSSDVQVAQQQTSSDGGYLFTNLTPGTYYIVVSNLPSGYVFTGQNRGSDEAADSDVDASGKSDPVTLTSGMNYRKLDAGLVKPKYAIRPFSSVVAECDGTFSARFGYENESPGVVSIPQGFLNFFLPVPADRGQTTAFQPGRVENAFTINWDGSYPLVWTLTGPDGNTRIEYVTAKGAAPAGSCVCDDPASAPSYAGGYVLNAEQTRAFVEVDVPAGGTTFEFYNTRNLVVGAPEDAAESVLPGVTRVGDVFTFNTASPAKVRFPISHADRKVTSVAFFLRITDACGRTVDVDPAFTLTGVAGGEMETFGLAQNQPNPFAGHTTITFSLDEASDVRLVLYDVLGREVAVLAEGPMAAGQHTARLDAHDLPAGQYLYRLTAGSRTLTRVMTLAR